jgi:protein tyrosine/serine phosphatase
MAKNTATGGGKGKPYAGNSAKLVKAQTSGNKEKPKVNIIKGKDLRSK